MSSVQQRATITAYLMALSRIAGLGSRTILQCLAAAGTPESLWEASDGFLKLHLNRIEQDKFKRGRDGIDPTTLMAPYNTMGIRVMTILDEDYPVLLKEIYDPPVVLYIRGNDKLLSHPRMLAMVGNRRISDYARNVTQHLVTDIGKYAEAAETCIVSGLAEGVDGHAHLEALNHQLPTIAVFGCGIDKIFPVFHEPLADRILDEGGALVSEYPLGYPGSKATFPQRNRIVSGMSHGVLIVEGSLRSGSLITARLALEENRQVFTVPGNIFAVGSQGPLKLLKQGAVPISTGREMLLHLDWISEEVEEAPPVQLGLLEATKLDGDSKLLYDMLTDEPIKLDALLAQTSWSQSKLQEILTLLELDGVISQLPGGRVYRL